MRRRIKVWKQVFSDRTTIQLQWIDEEGNRRTKTSGTSCPIEAEAARCDLESALNDGRYRHTARRAWSDFRAAFFAEHVAGLRPASQDKYANALDHFERCTVPTSLAGISQRTISLFVSKLRGGPVLQPSSIKTVLAYLHAALAWGKRQGFLSDLPVFPTVKVPRKRPQPVPPELVERLLAVCDAHWRAFLLCGWLAGLRRNEALALEWGPVKGRGAGEVREIPWLDLDRNRIWLPAGFVKAAEDQWVPLDPQLRQALTAIIAETGEDYAKTMHGPIFDFDTSPAGVSSLVRTIARRAGVRLTMRDLRRGFVCRYAGKVPAQVLQKLARHADIRLTLGYYANVDEAAETAVLGTVTVT